ncbi:MAG: FAD-binding oxidoreductase [Planktotalea sp.]|uniref:NAD(P)/FAD-dependent oxidoreductase n=1 Tax=Planktotalea sp. TaxID=2029877 RepID=UPI0005946EE0|nr:FAD-binding oxidoreductase [Planktotalea sp.]MBT5823171.1 FAD-binding oxidoreductase [Paracoccaceae bacterium]MDG1075852.1 FAD-binding oxidoreductase [Planktotalea sp.]MDG1083019.1 FAD-binding oxidoreductase [Planktotalea sp.]HCW83259.1 FAD-dependent oxidoreductase [Paracoccaceae bacterium]
MQRFDIAVVGAGISGASVAARLARAGKHVALLDMESQAGYHTTGRSAAIFAPSYGPAVIRALARASQSFFETPPEGFSETPLLSPRLIMMLARADQQAALDGLSAQLGDDPTISVVDEPALRAINPLVRAGYANGALLDRAGQDIDVNALHRGFLRQLTAASGTILLNAEVHTMTRQQSIWTLNTKAGEVEAEIVVNAAGAWADKLGQMAQAEHIRLLPKRRTAMMITAPRELTPDFPMTIDIEEQFYLKPETGRLLISPADETLSYPCDAQPEELDIAICVDRIEKAFDLSVRRIESKWAGLRSFVADGTPVAGFSQRVDGFYWLAGQGGYGIQTAPALSAYAACEILGEAPAAELALAGVDPKDLMVTRLS